LTVSRSIFGVGHWNWRACHWRRARIVTYVVGFRGTRSTTLSDERDGIKICGVGFLVSLGKWVPLPLPVRLHSGWPRQQPGASGPTTRDFLLICVHTYFFCTVLHHYDKLQLLAVKNPTPESANDVGPTYLFLRLT
jgi:hypothetical protein